MRALLLVILLAGCAGPYYGVHERYDFARPVMGISADGKRIVQVWP